MYIINENITNVVEKVGEEIAQAPDKNTVFKIYRQARNWSRFHCYYEKACSSDECKAINSIFKDMKNKKLEELK